MDRGDLWQRLEASSPLFLKSQKIVTARSSKAMFLRCDLLYVKSGTLFLKSGQFSRKSGHFSKCPLLHTQVMMAAIACSRASAEHTSRLLSRAASGPMAPTPRTGPPEEQTGPPRNAREGGVNSQPSTLNPQPSTLNPQSSTLSPQPSTLNPQPSTFR